MSAPQSEADAHGVRSSTTFEAQVAGTILTCGFMRDQGDLKTLSRLSFMVRLSWKGSGIHVCSRRKPRRDGLL